MRPSSTQGPHPTHVLVIGVGLACLTFLSVTGAGAGSRTPVNRDLGSTADDLGTLGGSNSYANGINVHGVVVGESSLTGNTSTHAYARDPITGVKDDIGTLGGTSSNGIAINDAGMVAGTSALAGDTTSHAYRWNPNTDYMRDLGTLGGTDSNANAINDDGLVAGHSLITGNTAYHAFVWDPATNDMHDLGTLGGTYSYAYGINDDGLVVGSSALPGDATMHAFVWDPATDDMHDLGTLGGSNSYGYAINDDGFVVGSSQLTGNATSLAYVWDPATDEMDDIGSLGGAYSTGNAINDDGVVVGYSNRLGNTAERAFVWSPASGMTDLGTVGGSAAIASGINDAGFIVGYGYPPGDATTHAILWTPPFVDVPLTHPFAEDIVWLVDNAITTGYDDDTFRPANVVTRQATAAFLYRSAGAPNGPDPTCTTAPFTDVPVDHPFCGEITWAADNDITTGYEGNTFKPAGNVTRQAFTAFLYRMAGAPDGPDPICVTALFTDVPTTHPFCGEIEWAADNDITTGYPDGTFRPANTVTRQATAAFLHRVAHLI